MNRIAIVVLVGCSHSSSSPATADAPALPDAASQSSTCATGDATKIKFTRANGCGNDGSVEFCIPSNNADVLARVNAVSTTITCSAGGGRAMCNDASLLLCTYPTAVPGQCEAQYGAMNDPTWTQMCSLSAFAEIHAIVQTIFE
jgi:hypothetical protein